MLLLISLAQSVVQIFSVALIFPFLTFAADPESLTQSEVGQWVVSIAPEITHFELLTISGGALFFGLLLANGMGLFAEYYQVRFIWRFAHWLRSRMLNRICRRPYGWFAQNNSALLLKKVTQDVELFSTRILQPIVDGISRLILSVMLIAGVIIVQPILAVLMGGVLVFYYLVIYRLLRGRRKTISDALNDGWQKIYLHATQLLSGIRVIRVQGVESEMIQRVTTPSAKQADLHSLLPVITNGPRYLLEPLLMIAAVSYVLYAIGSGADFTQMLPGLGFAALASYRLLPAMQALYAYGSGLGTMRYTLDEVYGEFEDIISDAPRPVRQITQDQINGKNGQSQQSGPLIAFEDVSFSYPGTDHATLANVTISFAEGDTVAIVGESGAGKSTLVDLILGLQRPTEGRVITDGQELRSDHHIRAWQNQLGYVPQDIFLIDDTISRNIAFGLTQDEIDMERVKVVSRMAQIADHIENKLPEQYDAAVGERGVQLSGGQRQRIALARALYNNPRVLILDEATSALDADTERRFMDMVFALPDDLTVIIVTHRAALAMRCSVVIRIAGGKVKVT